MAAAIPSASPIPPKIPAPRLVGPTAPKFHKTRPSALCAPKSVRISASCRDRSVEASAKETVGRRGDGAQRRIRTTDTRIFSPLLYQLSYLGLFRLTKTRAPDFMKAPWAPLESAWVIAWESGLSSAQMWISRRKRNVARWVGFHAVRPPIWRLAAPCGSRMGSCRPACGRIC